MNRALLRFIKYSCIGGGTFLIDLVVLFILIDWVHLNYLFAAAISFLAAVSLNYFISRKIVFVGSTRKLSEGYFWFIIIALSGMGMVVGMMYTLVVQFHMHYILARIFIATLTGFWNYLLNLYFNFRVAGK